jgi:NADPH:quinone reductase-like Zn-dependent oxidoreductase
MSCHQSSVYYFTSATITTTFKQFKMAESIQNGIFRRNNTAPPADGGVMSLFSLAGKTAIISGAGGGIGLAAVKAFAEAGANVAIWYNTNNEAIDKAASIEKAFNVKCNRAEFEESYPFSV